MPTAFPTIHKDPSKFKKTPNLPDYEAAYKTFSWEAVEKENIAYFLDGTINAAYNVIDKHAKSDKANKTALLYEGAKGEKETYSFSDLSLLSNKFANVLVSQGVVKSDRVFIFLPPIPERYVAFLGILKTGAIAGTMFAAFQENALLDRLADSGAKIVVTNADLFPRIQKLWDKLPKLEKVILIERDMTTPPQEPRLIFYNAEMAKAPETFEIAHMKKEDPAYMLYTSGTTGKPKGVVHAHHDVLQAMLTTKYVLDVHDDDIYWCTADMGWVTGVVYGVLGIWGVGGTSVIFEGRFSADGWYKILQDYKVTVWYTAPTAIRMLMSANIDLKQFNLSNLRHLCSVGEPLNPEAVEWGIKALGLAFHDSWWQTELGSICITNFPTLDVKPGSMGKPFLGVVAAVVDENGKEVAVGTEGDLALKPESVSSIMKQIWQNEEKYKSYFANGWYISGDRATKDSDGYFWFVGRADDVIKVSGERIGPFEIESTLIECPEVVEAGAIGKPDELRGEIIKAFVVLKPGVLPSEDLKQKLMMYVKQHLAGHAYPREIEFIDKLPKTRSGKIMRRILKAKELGQPIGDTSTLEDY
ncbi:MAG TPA: acetate--CoA ligase [Candidatus Saccharimonadales bacterium]|nr:acetate--CoA ligase [Candidatus Saccharimonadales bacterium]